jgi:hypothetical protein
MESTPTCVLTMLGSRFLSFSLNELRRNSETGQDTWYDVGKLGRVLLTKNSLFVLHPDNERPNFHQEYGGLTKWKHGFTNYKESNQVSIALVYQTVTGVQPCVDMINTNCRHEIIAVMKKLKKMVEKQGQSDTHIHR